MSERKNNLFQKDVTKIITTMLYAEWVLELVIFSLKKKKKGEAIET